MRGDSLRDFYAKTLAVVGLGLLACAGAIVDYWPVNEELPTAPAAVGLVRQAPALVQNLSIEIPAPVIRAVVAKPRPANFITSVDSTLPVSVADATPAVALEAAPLPQDLVIVEMLSAATPIDDVIDFEPAPMQDNMTEESRRLFGDALKRTKQRIAAARLLFNNAMSGVVGAFRKASPFFTTTAIVPGLQ